MMCLASKPFSSNSVIVVALRQWLVCIFDSSSSCDKVFNFAPSVFCPQSLEVSKIKKNKKNFEKVWSSIINKVFLSDGWYMNGYYKAKLFQFYQHGVKHQVGGFKICIINHIKLTNF